MVFLATRGNPYKVLLKVSQTIVRHHFLQSELPLYGIVCHPQLLILELCHYTYIHTFYLNQAARPISTHTHTHTNS